MLALAFVVLALQGLELWSKSQQFIYGVVIAASIVQRQWYSLVCHRIMFFVSVYFGQ